MPKTRELSECERGQIVAAHEDGMSQRQIAQKMKCSRCAVQTTLRRFKETRNVKTMQRTGRRKITAHLDDRSFGHQDVKNRQTTSEEDVTSTSQISTRTIRRRLVEYGLISGANVKKLLQWAKNHSNWTSEQWLKVILSDKSSYENSTITTSTTTMSTNIVPSIGKPAPQFKGTAVVNGEFRTISLSDYNGKYVILFFYPLDFTFVCPTEIIAFSERAEEFRRLGCELIACSTDSHFSHLAWINQPRKEGGLGHMNIPLLADKSMAISRAYGVLKEDEGVAFRGLFIIDQKQNLRQVTINDLPVGRDVDEALRLLQAFQFTDTHGEVCPAGWKPGAKAMKADPEGSKQYFESQN